MKNRELNEWHKISKAAKKAGQNGTAWFLKMNSEEKNVNEMRHNGK